MTTASLAGVATHLPGLFYVVALNAIVAEGRGLLAGVLYVLLFNATTLVFTAAGAYLAIKGTTGLAG